MNNTLGKCLLCLCTLANILVICSGVNVQSPLHTTTRTPSQSGGICQRLRNPANGRYTDLFNTSVEQQLLPLNSVLWYVCDEGYQIFPKNTLLICLRDGSWSQDPPICTKPCPALHSTATTKVQCFDKSKTEIKCDEAIDGGVAQFECATNYVLADRQIPISICWSGSWNIPPPQCIKSACPLLNSTGIEKVQCFDKYKTEIKCDETSDQSTAKFQCAPYYEPAERNRELLYCSSRSWDLPAPQCIPVCGEKKVLVSAILSHEGNNYPWVTAIFIKYDGVFINTCGGTMLTEKVILTAAHCIADLDNNPRDKATIKVAVGKYYNKYMDERDIQAQYSDVEHILIHPKFKGLYQHYSSDIAFLVTKKTLVLSKAVQPVCFRNLPNIDFKVGSEGVVTGWGFTAADERPSEVLKEIPITLKDDATCISDLPPNWLDKYNSYDKFCAGKDNKSLEVCKGDSGGGLVFKNLKDDRFYVHGLVSVGGPTRANGTITKGCGLYSISLFTKIAIHYDWLEQIVSQYATL